MKAPNSIKLNSHFLGLFLAGLERSFIEANAPLPSFIPSAPYYFADVDQCQIGLMVGRYYQHGLIQLEVIDGLVRYAKAITGNQVGLVKVPLPVPKIASLRHEALAEYYYGVDAFESGLDRAECENPIMLLGFDDAMYSRCSVERLEGNSATNNVIDLPEAGMKEAELKDAA